MAGRRRWRPALAALLGAVAVAAAVAGGVQASSPDPVAPRAVPGAARSTLPGAGDDAVAPPIAVVVRPPVFAPSAIVPTPLPAVDAPPATAPRPPHRVGSGYDPDDPAYQGADDPGTAAGRAPTSGESQHDWGCRRGSVTEGC